MPNHEQDVISLWPVHVGARSGQTITPGFGEVLALKILPNLTTAHLHCMKVALACVQCHRLLECYQLT